MSWKKVFLDLYMSFDYEKYKKALELKRKNFPNKLYRYRSLTTEAHLERVGDEIETGTIFLSHRKDFNDPFDSVPLLQYTQANYYFNNDIRKNEFKKHLFKYYTSEEIEDVFSNDDWYSKAIALFAKQIVNETKSPKTEFDIANEINNTFMEPYEETTQTICYNLNTLRIACFSELHNNLPMWAHYANNHTGVCLEYDIKSILEAHTLDHILNFLYPVFYVKVLPDSVNGIYGKYWVDFDEERKQPKTENNTWRVHPIIDYPSIHKLKEWQYEREWRLIQNIAFFRKRLDVTVTDMFNYEKGIPMIFNKPSRVYLGYNISKNNENSIIETCQKSNIPFSRMEVTHYGLKIKEKPVSPKTQTIKNR